MSNIRFENLSTPEIIREAEDSNNTLALALGQRMEEGLEEREEGLEEALEELARHYAGKIERAIEEVNADDLKADSDNVTNYTECIESSISEHDVERVITELKEEDRCGRNTGLTEGALAYLVNLVETSNQEALSDLAYAIVIAGAGATDVVMSHGFGSVANCLTSTAMGEAEFELEYWLEEVPAALHAKVLQRLTGSEDGELFYIDNTYEAVNLTASLDYLEEWVADQLEEAAAAPYPRVSAESIGSSKMTTVI